MTAYTTKTDAMNEIKSALDEYVNDYDLDAMFDELYQYDEVMGGFVERENVDFWEIAQKHDISDGQEA